MKTLHTTLSLVLIATLIFSCSDESDENADLQEFEVSINPIPEAINIVENGRLANGPTEFTDFFYYLYDSECNEIDSEGRMLFGGESIESIVLPNLTAGTYYYRIALHGAANIKYDSVGSFELASDTVLEAYLNNKQMRFRFHEVSDFSETEVSHITYFIHYNTIYEYEHFSCEAMGNWNAITLDGFFSTSVYGSDPDLDSQFEYQSPLEMESVQVKFYNSDNTLLKSSIIPLVRSLEKHHSYTFQIDLSSIWASDPNGSSIYLNLEDFSWTEETVEVN